MPFRNSIVAAVIQTALSGARVVIDQFGAVGGQIRIYTGIVTETAPESFSASWQGSPLNRYISRWTGATGTNMAGKQPPVIQLTTQEVTGDMAIDLIAERVTMFKSGGLVSPELRVDGPAGIDVLGAWVPFVPTLSSGGVQPTFGASTLVGAYMKIGKTVMYRFRFVTGAGWAPGTGDYYLSIPVPAKHGSPSVQIDCGAGFIFNAAAAGVYAGTWYMQNPNNLTFMIAASPGAANMGAGQMAAGSNFGGTITYEAA